MYGPVPPAPVAVALPSDCPQWASDLVIDTVGFGFTVTVTLAVAVQPFASVTVTL